MTIERKLRHFAEIGDHFDPEGNIRYEYAVHHVEVDHIRTALFRRSDLLSRSRKISRQYGRRDQHFSIVFS